MKKITLELGNSCWWKNLKYRKEAAQELKRLRKKKKIKLKQKYKIDGSNTILYGDYLVF